MFTCCKIPILHIRWHYRLEYPDHFCCNVFPFILSVGFVVVRDEVLYVVQRVCDRDAILVEFVPRFEEILFLLVLQLLDDELKVIEFYMWGRGAAILVIEE